METTASFRLFGDETLTATAATRRLGIQPDTELAEHLHRLLDILEPATPLLWELIHAGYHANWFCYIASHATEHAAELDRRTLQRLLALPGDLWLDICGDDTDERKAG